MHNQSSRLHNASLTRRRRLLVIPALFALVLAGAAQAQVPSNIYSYSRTSSFVYYGTGDGAKAGLLKSETIEPSKAQLCVVTSYDYDAYGNKTSSTTANCAGASGRALFETRTSSSAFAAVTSQAISVGSGSVNVAVPAGLFASSSTNALSHGESKTYDPRFGAPLRLTGPNQLPTNWKVDDFGRLTQEIRADGTQTVSAYCTLGGFGLDTTANSNTANGDPLSCPNASADAPSDAVSFVHTEPRDSSSSKIGPFVRVYKDRLGRDLRSVTEAFDGSAQAAGKSGALVYKDAVYNVFGVKIVETQAYFAGSGSSTTGGSGDVGLSLTVVDILGRPMVVYVADPNGNAGGQSFGIYGARTAARTSFDYSGLTTTVTNDKGQTRKEDKNPLGELVRVTDASGATLIHQRDAFGNLVQTKDALGNLTKLTYDFRGRKTKLEDPDTGTWNYDYDALGQLVWQQSPNQQVAPVSETTMVYDVLGRLTSRGEPEYISTWTYDKNADGSSCMNANANQGKGKLCQSGTKNGVSRQYVYDSLGRPTSSRTSVSNGPSFASSVSYDSLGRVQSQTYPTGVQIGYSYTPRGFLEKLLLNTPATVAPLPNASGQTAAGASLAAGTVLWQAQVVGAWGKVEQQRYGNNVTNKATFQAGTGRITDLTAAASGSGTNNVLAQHYVWDSLSNLQSRGDDNGDGNTGAVTETFSYGDSLNRLTGYTVSAPAIPNLSRSVTLQYNALGMLLYKSDVANYTYSAQGGAAGSKPHALQSVTGVLNTSYGYDANGNLTSTSTGKYRSLSYTSFNLPDGGNGLQGANGLPKYSWQYDENHARIRETHQDGSGTRTTWYMHPDNQGGLGFESETAPNGLVSNRHYLTAGGQVIGVLVRTGALPTLGANQTTPPTLTSATLVKVEYWHKDHLGSLITTTDHVGNVTGRYAYDPFGKRRYTSGTYDPFGALIVDWVSTQNAGTDRGYTGHEHLDDVGIVHMNGRLFDPNLGIMMQADPLVGDQRNLQNYNRYGYCFNNPLSCTDPSGYDSWSDMRHAFVDTWHYGWRNPTLRMIGSIFAAFVLGPGGPGALFEGAGSGLANAATAGFVSGAIASGNVKGAMQGAFTAGVFYGVGSLIDGYTLSPTEGVMLHAVAGCVTSEVSGGKCGPGALSAAFSEIATVNGWQASGYSGVITSVIIGGTASVLGGGKFANGARTAAFGYLFNCGAHDCWNKRKYGNVPTEMAGNVAVVNELLLASGNEEWIAKAKIAEYRYVDADPYDKNGNRILATAKGSQITFYRGSLSLSDYGQTFLTAHEFGHLLPVGRPDNSWIMLTPNFEAAADGFAIRLLKIAPSQRLPNKMDTYFNNATSGQRSEYYPGR
ncbi:RHS repeat domain-containing protein [Roseateles sp. P5_D6]